MSYKTLRYFLENRMKMSHIYQPVMILKLLTDKGKSDKRSIAELILSYDESQKEYYENVTTNMVGKVLTKNNDIATKNGDVYSLKGYDKLSISEVESLKKVCRKKIDDYLATRENVWEHRRKSKGYISGSIRLKVFNRAKTKCEMCGISNKVKALEVDHIIPRNKGGSDDISNLQALCYTCNSIKSDKDDSDLAAVRESYEYRDRKCIFCNVSGSIIMENELAFAIYDKFPVTNHHTLVIPKRHIDSYFKLYQPEINALNDLMSKMKAKLDKKDNTITGYNIGINNGESAGQTVLHSHIHLIPRRDKDVKSPLGGVRGVIPEKMKY